VRQSAVINREARVAKGKARAKQVDPVVDQLDQIKRLIMLQLLMSGVKANQIAKALGVAKSVISGIMPIRSIGLRE
jgi:hypothetical protein